MQRHRHNVKVSKLLVGLRPYQAYTKRHPWASWCGPQWPQMARNPPWCSFRRVWRWTRKFTWTCCGITLCPGPGDHSRTDTSSPRTVHHRTRRSWHNSGARATSMGSGTRTCGPPPAQTWTRWTSRSGPSWRQMCARPHTAAPPSSSRPWRRHGPTWARTPCSARACRWWGGWRPWWRLRVVTSKSSAAVWRRASVCVCVPSFEQIRYVWLEIINILYL